MKRKNLKRTSAKSYPRRSENKRELLKASNETEKKPYENGAGRRAVPNQRVGDFADTPTEEGEGGIPKKVAQCKRVKFGGRRAGPTR